jgi:hypothetical protein
VARTLCVCRVENRLDACVNEKRESLETILEAAD